MCAIAADQKTIVRPIKSTDVSDILRLVDSARRVHLRLSPDSLKSRLGSSPGFLAEDPVGLRGFMVVEPQHSGAAVIVAAALRDTWGVRPYLDTVLPEIERAAQEKDASTISHIGYDKWLVDGLRERGFEVCEWIVNFERFGSWPKATVAMPALVRTAHLYDLPAILALDNLVFDQLWRKTESNFSEALARAVSFVVAEMQGQIVGYEWCEIYRKHAHLARIAVHPDYQGHGIGSQLLYQAIVDSLSRNVNVITLNTQEDNERSHALYKRFDFVKTDQRTPVLCKSIVRPE
jgi:ribosomal protein S18 acetylase RimI-like enzyme